MQRPSTELHQIATKLRRSSIEVAELGRRLQHRAAVTVWHASAADAFRARMSARRAEADSVARALEHAAATLDAHATTVAHRDFLTRTLRRLWWL